MGRHGRDVSHSGSGEDEDYQRVGIFTKAINIQEEKQRSQEGGDCLDVWTSNEINAHLFPKLSPRNCIVNFTLPRDGTSFVLSCHFTISLLIKALVWEFGQIL